MTPTTLGLLALAVAAGLGPYSSIAALGFLGQSGLGALPAELTGISSVPILAASTALLALDAAASRFRVPDLLWNALHTIIRPAVAALLVVAAGSDLGETGLWLAALGGGASGLLAHLLVLSTRSASRTAGPLSFLPGFTALRITGGGMLAALALLAPPFAGALAAVLILAPLPWFPRLWGAARMALAASISVWTRAGRGRSWQGGRAGPPSNVARALAAVGEESLASARVCPATLGRYGAHWLYSGGFILLRPGRQPIFARRRWGRLELIDLESGPGASDEAAVLETLEIRCGRPYSLCLGPDAPPGGVVLAELGGPSPGRTVGGTR